MEMPPQPEKPKPKALYKVILKSAPDPDQAAEVIIRRASSLDPDRIRSLVKSLPAEVVTNMDGLYAEDIAGALREIGADAEKRVVLSSVTCEYHEGQPGRSQCMICGKVICSECIKAAKGQRLCVEHSGAEKPEVPSTFPWIRLTLLLLLIGAGVYVYLFILKKERPNFAFDRPYKLAVVHLIVDVPEERAKYVRKFMEDQGTAYDDLQNHTLPHMTGWLQREYERYGGSMPQVLEMESFGPAFISDAPPDAPPLDQNVFNAFIDWRKYQHFFRQVNDKNKIDTSGYDGVIYVQWTEGNFDEIHESNAAKKINIGLARCYLGDKYREQNIMIVLHELFHLWNAQDHYDGNSYQPLDPTGLADPYMEPKYPQEFADVMAGNIAVSEDSSRPILGLRDLRVNIFTAHEVGWVGPEEFTEITTVTQRTPSLY